MVKLNFDVGTNHFDLTKSEFRLILPPRMLNRGLDILSQVNHMRVWFAGDVRESQVLSGI